MRDGTFTASLTYSSMPDGPDVEGCIITHLILADNAPWNGDVWMEGDYHLRSVSVCIDNGDPALTRKSTDVADLAVYRAIQSVFIS